jgi:hypothetical protein
MLWLELSGAEATTTHGSTRGDGIRPDVNWEYQFPELWLGLESDETSSTGTESKATSFPGGENQSVGPVEGILSTFLTFPIVFEIISFLLTTAQQNK